MEKCYLSKRKSLKYERRTEAPKPDLKAVSEAIGTILLLAISVSLVGVVTWWVQTFPEPKETIDVELSASIDENHIISIDHLGGDALDIEQIKIYVKIDGVTQGSYQLIDSKLSIFDDGFWSIGEIWTKNVQLLHDWNISLPQVDVDVVDVNADSIVYSAIDILKGGLGNLPDLRIAEEDISFKYLNQTLRNGEWVNISIRVHNFGGSIATNVLVRLFDDNKIISQNNKDYIYINTIGVNGSQTVWANWTPIYFGFRTINVNVYSPHLENDYKNNHASKELEIEPTLPTITGPNLEIEDIIFNPTTPSHGDWVTITVLVKNVGDEEVPIGTEINLTLWDDNGYLLSKDVKFALNRTLTKNLTQYESIQPPFTYNSQTTYGGKTKIKAEITASYAGSKLRESREDDNYLDKYIQILPTILLVDDDGQFEIYGKEDTSSYMDAALQLAVGSGQFDIWSVKGVDGPKFESGDKPLRNYDIVIWMTGYQTTSTLTNSDQIAIKQFLENNGKLWLIGMNIMEDIRLRESLPAGTVNNFVYNYLGVEYFNTTGTPEFLFGISGENLTQGMELNTSNMVKSKDNGINFTLRGSGSNRSIDGILGNDQVLGMNGNMSLKYYNQTENFTFKVVYFGWEFAYIIDMINRNNLTTQVLKWFDWELEIGTDLAISSKGFSKNAPNFMDWITISARVRNSGAKDLSRVRVDFFIIDSNGRETRIPEYPGFENVDNPQFIYISGGGGEREVEKKWLAVSVGQKTFRVVVDLEDEIEEVSEENNDDFYSPLFVTQLYIGYTILVVDDDNSSNNGGNFNNASQEITNAIDELGYFYDTHVIAGGSSPEIGPNITVMKHYNSVIWCTGYDGNDTLLPSDLENLTNYFTRGFPEADFLGETKLNAWIIGQGILDDLGGSGASVSPPTNSFLYKYLRIDSYSTVNSKLSEYVEGVYRDNITHGINYPMIQSIDDFSDTITPTSDAYGILWQDNSHTKYNAIRYNSTNYNMVFTPWVFSLINDSTTAHLPDESYKDELCYLILRWFEYPDIRFELKTSAIDIKISHQNPVLGNSYIIKSNIYNLGTNDTNAIVRFLDGDTVINTKSVYIPANGNSTTEVIWSPLYAGFRDIYVSVDPDDDTLEVFDVLNNNASLSDQLVYFFYDDLENGTSNWAHDSTVILINGESPLEYMDTPVFSNVNYTWNTSLTNGFAQNISLYHSYGSSYFTYEPLGSPNKVALDIVLSLDTSGSMTGTPINDLKTAAKNFINHPMLDSRDRVAIYGFYNEAPRREQDFTVCDDAGKTSMIATINGLTANGFTPLWDTIGESVNYIKNQGSTRTPIVIAMTDGEDYGNQGPEDGSETYCPWHKWEGGSIQYHNVDTINGHDHFTYDGGGNPSTESNWRWENLDDEWRDGLLNITDVSVYTVGLGLQHNNHTGDSCWRFPNGWMGAFAPYESVEHSWSTNRNSTIYNESGTPEYGLWRVANTSGGEYFYAAESSKLNGIFQTIAASIVEETTVDRAITSEDSRSRSGATEGSRSSSRAQLFSEGFESGTFNPTWNVDAGWTVEPSYQHSGIYYALGRGVYTNARMTITSDIDLSDYEDVKLNFWQYTYDVEDTDLFRIDVSINSGTSWTNIREWQGNSIEDNDYNYYSIPLAAYDDEPNFRIRFRFTMNAWNEYWLIDDLEIVGNKTSGGEIPIPPELFEPVDRNLTTYPFSLENVSSAKLSFYHKYNLRLGLNGVVVMVGTPNATGADWNFEYARPTQSYTGNYYTGETRYDDFGNDMRWVWNGISGTGKFTWDYIEVDLTNWTGLDRICVRIAFLWVGAGLGGGYYVDDFKIQVSRNESIELTNNSVDQWNLTNERAHSGTYCWWNHDIGTGNLSSGLDNSLYTRPIDLTNARNATLSAYFMFNINTAAGRPPDGFRVEVSSDNGVTWKAINMGVRTAWGVSGNGSDADDGMDNDGKSYTGLDVFGPDESADGWVEANTLTRLNTDISGWAGSVIILRFRIVTASDNNPHFGNQHYESATAFQKGILIDDVIIYGFSLLN